MTFKEYSEEKHPPIDFATLRAQSLQDNSKRKFCVQFVDYYKNYVKDYTEANNLKTALINVISKAFNEKKIVGCPTIGRAISVITKNPTNFEAKVTDLKHNISFKDSKLKRALDKH